MTDRSTYIPMIILLVGAAALAYLLMSRPDSTPRPRPPEAADIDRSMEALNQRAQYWQAVRSDGLPAIDGERKPYRQYVLQLKDAALLHEFLFKKYQYTYESGGDPALLPTKHLCDLADSLLNKPDKIETLLRSMKTEAGFSVGFFSLNIEVQNLLAELWCFIRQATLRGDLKVEILIKGYADGNYGDWSRRQDSIYDYRSITVMPAIEPGQNAIHYSRNMVERIIPAIYTNTDLPNLRAAFIKERIIEPFAEDCPDNINGIHILDGYAFTMPGDTGKRKAQVFLRIREQH
jgi:hypothetical protein